jgi:hypothetical protein
MSPRRKRLVLLIAGLLLLAGVGVGLFLFRQAGAARERIVQALGEPAGAPYMLNDPAIRPQPQAIPDWSAPPEEQQAPSPGGELSNGLPLSDLLSAAGGVSVRETESAYEIRVPLADAEDAERVTLDVTPHHIRVSGQTGVQADEGHTPSPGVSVTSSFLQSFDTSREVLPDQVSRRLERDGSQLELMITIPKKAGSAAGEPTQSRELPGFDDSRSPVF